MDGVNPGRTQVIHVTVACGILATLAVFLRFLARWRSKASLGADDWWMLASLVPSYGMLAVGSIMITSGRGGHHADTLTATQMATFLKTLDAAIMTYTLTIAMVKISILLLYRRIFTTRHFRMATLLVGIACVSWLIAALLCLAFQCHTETERYDTASLFSDQCIDLKVYWAAVASSNMGLDLIILCMPLYMVWNLRITIRQKVALTGIFALGSLVCVAGLMRIITIDLVKGGDLTYTIITCYMWSQIEPTMAIVCACLTTLRPLLTGISFDFLSSLRWSSKRTASSSTANGKGRWSDPSLEPESDQGKKEARTGALAEHHRRDIELLGFEQVVNAGAQGDITIVESTESSRRGSSWLEDGTTVPSRAKSEESFV